MHSPFYLFYTTCKTLSVFTKELLAYLLTFVVEAEVIAIMKTPGYIRPKKESCRRSGDLMRVDDRTLSSIYARFETRVTIS